MDIDGQLVHMSKLGFVADRVIDANWVSKCQLQLGLWQYLLDRGHEAIGVLAFGGNGDIPTLGICRLGLTFSAEESIKSKLRLNTQHGKLISLQVMTT